jgi:hypothetical protein
LVALLAVASFAKVVGAWAMIYRPVAALDLDAKTVANPSSETHHPDGCIDLGGFMLGQEISGEGRPAQSPCICCAPR